MRKCDALEELALGRAGVSHDAHVDVSSQRGALHGRLANASKQHEQHAALHLVVACGDAHQTTTTKIHRHDSKI